MNCCAQIRRALRARAQKQVLGQEPFVKRLRHAGHLLELLLVDLAVDDVHRRFRLRARDPRLQARHDRQPAAAPALQIVPGRRHLRLHHHRHHDVGVAPTTMPKKPGGVTPTMVIGRPLSVIVRLSTDRSPANRRIQ